MKTNSIEDGDTEFDYLFKIVLIGDPGVGKTAIVQRFKYNTFVDRHASTIGVDFLLKTLEIDGKKIKVIHWYKYRASDNLFLPPNSEIQSCHPSNPANRILKINNKMEFREAGK